MIKQTNFYTGGDAEACSANSADQLMSSGQIKNAVDEGLRIMELERTAIPAMPKGVRNPDARTLEAYVERRRKLATQIRAENPSCTEEEIEARLEVFGA
jgi:hypothetical protein